jgi:phosphotransferase system enzyme I (PtsI)
VLLQGAGVSAGVAKGEALVLACGQRAAAARRTIRADEVGGERARLEEAFARAASDLRALQRDVGERLGPTQADVLGAQVLALEDQVLRERVVRAVEEERINAESAVSGVIDQYTRGLGAAPDAYLRERAADLRDVGRRVLSTLVERVRPDGPEIPDGAIVVAEELLPSVTARLQLDHVGALVTERGHRFSHTAILARALGTPAVVGVAEAAKRIRTGDRLVVDGVAGVVFVHPDATIEREYDSLLSELRAHEEELESLVGVPSVSRDGTAVPLLANVSKFADTEAALRWGAEGIGLYRTEFAFSIRPRFPTEEEQYEFLARAAEQFHPRPVVLRLLDLGGDKILPYFPLPPSRNPSLAERGIRLLLRHPELLRTQLRAFLRVSADHPVSILLPVVGGVEDVRQARAVVRQVQAELAAAGRRFDPDVPVGAMIEVPSAALMTRALAEEVDFLSLGTNDLVQYVLSADREDETVAAYYQPTHPAVLRLLRLVAEESARAGCALTLCGEMGGDPRLTALLLGLGIRELSVAPGALLEVKRAIRSIAMDEASVLARRALEVATVAEVEALLGPESRRQGAPVGRAGA